MHTLYIRYTHFRYCTMESIGHHEQHTALVDP